MRVIAGRFRGRRLRAPRGPDTRPVADRVKESLFSSLGDRVVAARVLDLYAGAGSFGIEALSRGAASATFVESARPALAALRQNLEALGLGPPEAVVVPRSVDVSLDGAGAVDLVFCDPPWPLGSEDLAGVLERVAGLLAEGGMVVVTRRAGDAVPAPSGLAIADDRRMGDTRILRYAKMGDR